MTKSSKSKNKITNLQQLEKNLSKVPVLTHRLVHALAGKKAIDPQLTGNDGMLLTEVGTEHFTNLLMDPAKLMKYQVNQWEQAIKYWSEIQASWMSMGLQNSNENLRENRFKHEFWDSHPFFQLLKQNYLLTAETIRSALHNLEGISESKQRLIDFVCQQIVDLIAPTNFLATNPEVLARTIDTNGQSLIDGLTNLVNDVEANDENLSVSLTDKNAFKVGENIATTPGAVIYQNELFQLIQYKPTTKECHETPLLIVPPCINKFYILDLKETNSFIRFAVSSGFTVFIMSWVNPTEEHRHFGLDTYIKEGILTAINEVKAKTKQPKVNTVGYCMGGTLLTMALAHLANCKDNSVGSATFFTTLTDFEEPGELSIFINNEFLESIEIDASKKGYLDGRHLAQTFSFLRSNELVYGPAIRSYLLGEAPPVFDLLYWNSDSTNLPERLVKEYLRQLYQNNEFIKGEFKLFGKQLDITKIKTPMFIIATKADHIAPWKSSFIGLNNASGKKTYVLSESGHIGGIVNPRPDSKNGHWLNTKPLITPEEWFDGAKRSNGTWWYLWQKWQAKHSGQMSNARQLRGNRRWPVIEPAPGSYVHKGSVSI